MKSRFELLRILQQNYLETNGNVSIIGGKPL